MLIPSTKANTNLQNAWGHLIGQAVFHTTCNFPSSAASNHNHRQHNDGHLEPHRYFNGIKLVAVKNNHNRTGTDVVDGIKNTSKRIKDIALHGSVRR